MGMPKKNKYRQHAHTNSFATYGMNKPKSPYTLDLPPAQYVDLGCGYGRFTLYLAETTPDKTIYGLEIRKKVYEFVRDKIIELQKRAIQQCDDHVVLNIKRATYSNVHVIRTNGMLFFPYFFKKRSLEKIFLLFPDPHFKKKKKKGRIASLQMAQYFEYCLMKHGRIYMSTDVEELFTYMTAVFDENKYFRMLNVHECQNDELFDKIDKITDESQRAGAKAERIYKAIYEKLEE